MLNKKRFLIKSNWISLKYIDQEYINQIQAL